MKVIKIFILSVYLMVGLNVYGSNKIAPPIKWNPGIIKGIPEVPIVVNVKKFGAKGNGLTDDSASFQKAIKYIESQNKLGAILIPAGKYLLRNSLEIFKGNVVLRGEGVEKTELIFNSTNKDAQAIKIANFFQPAKWQKILKGYNLGSKKLFVENPYLFHKGGYAEIKQKNDASKMYTSEKWNNEWAQDLVGQIVEIVQVNNDSIIIDSPLRYNYDSKFNPVIRPVKLVLNVGIEDLKLIRKDRTDTFNFLFKYAGKSWIKNVESKYARRGHIYADSSYRLVIRDSFFNDATSWKGGGFGYGVNFGLHVSDCLVENNIFYHLRHSFLAHVGANGNVFAYNYSLAPYQNEGGDWVPADVSFHGHYAFANLVEGNIIQLVACSDYWGPVGPYNTFLRNLIEYEDIHIEDGSNYQYIIGNFFKKGEVKVNDFTWLPGRVDESTLIIFGNYIKGKIEWGENNFNHKIPISYYLKTKPEFYNELNWPSIGADIKDGTIPAETRYMQIIANEE